MPANAAIAAGPSREAAQYQNQELQFATRVQELRDDTLPLMERMEVLEHEVRELQAALTEIGPQLSELAQAEEVRVAQVEEKISTLMDERNQVAHGLDARSSNSTNRCAARNAASAWCRLWTISAAAAAVCVCPFT